MAQWRRGLSIVVLAILLTLPLTVVTVIGLNLRSNRVLLELTQPAALDYKSYGPYSVYVLEGSRDWSNLNLPRRYFLLVGRAGMNSPDHGHMLDYTFHSDSSTDTETHIRESTTEWGAEGVTFIEATGHRLFIPKKMFLGGR